MNLWAGTGILSSYIITRVAGWVEGRHWGGGEVQRPILDIGGGQMLPRRTCSMNGICGRLCMHESRHRKIHG